MILTEGYAEVKKDGQWHLDGEMYPNDPPYVEPEEPKLLPLGLFGHGLKRFSWIFQGWPAMSDRILPQDLSTELKTYFDWEKHITPNVFISWYTLQELQDIQWEGNLLRRQALAAPEYAHLFNGKDQPQELLQYPRTMPIYRGVPPHDIPPADYVKVTWYEKFDDIIVNVWRDEVKNLAALGEPENVRLFILIG